MDEIEDALDESGLQWTRVGNLAVANVQRNDIIFLDAFLDESTLIHLYAAANVMVLPYLNMEQMSSGILADTLGSGRVAIATKFRYARELIYSNKICPPGLVIGRYARGILVDPGPDSIEQIAEGLDYLVFNKEKRIQMERQAHQRGHQMRWDNSAWALIQHIEYIMGQKEIRTGRGVTFNRDKDSKYQRKRKR
jgi:glycosyltransferase involved in cell wall biosynthesis